MRKYTNEWKGLDQGVEHTWNPEVIEAVTKEIAKLGTVNHTDPESPLYKRLYELFPDKTWVSTGSDGSARTIFRRSNTWARLGLAAASSGNMRLTPLGESFIIGNTTINEVLISALANHEENGERPFTILATAFLELPTRVFSLEDIEIRIMGHYRPDNDNISDALSATSEPITPTRKRRARAMMSRLEDVHAITPKDNGWIASDVDTLSQISGRQKQVQIAAEINLKSLESNNETKLRKTNSITSRKFQHGTPNFDTSRSRSAYDPQKRKELLEKASVGHAKLLMELAKFIEQQGYEPTEDPQSYDMACMDNDKAWIFEAKTCTENNAKDQIRKAISQLYEYQWRGRDLWPDQINLAIVIDKRPEALLEPWVLDFLHNDRKIFLIWLEDGEFKIWDEKNDQNKLFSL